MRFLAMMAVGLWLVLGQMAQAETCGGTYRVKPGDSLSVIADRLYKNVGMWSVIHQNNLGAIGDKPNAIRVGMRLNLTCLDGLPVGLPGGKAATVIAAAVTQPIKVQPGNAATRSKINLLTADDFAPFTDRKLPGGGLLTEVVQSAMEAAHPTEGFAIHWVNDWSAHFEPLLSNALLDMGFPWYKPDCTAQPDSYRCQNLLFSDPMFEILVLLFTDKSRPLLFRADQDMIGKRLCRPKGYFTHDLEKNGRKWVSEGKIELKQPVAVKDCFDMLLAGEVDAVALNEFTGRTAINDLGLKDKVDIVQSRPLSIEGLHVVVHKSHPQARAMLDTINAGLRDIKKNGTYQTIIDQHMTRIWAGF